MPTRKNVSKLMSKEPVATLAPKSRKGRTARRSNTTKPERTTHTSGRNRFNVTDYAMPGAAVLATGALATAGYMLKAQLAELLGGVVKVAAKNGIKAAGAVDTARDQAMNAVERVSDVVSVDALLRYAGLQRRSTFGAIALPAIGVGLGFVAGSALTYFFGPRLLEQIKTEAHAFTSDMKKDEPTLEPDASDGASSNSADGPRPNGSLHRGIS
jgi:hypothetical protein